MIEPTVPLSRRDLIRFMALAGGAPLAGSLLAACAPQPTPSSPAQPSGSTAPQAPRVADRITVATSLFPPTFDPGLLFVGDSGEVIDSAFDNLVRMENDRIAPGLATAWRSDDGGKTWTFTLRPNVRFQNGDPLQASDVVFSYKRGISSGPNGAPMTGFSRIATTIEDVVAVDPLTVRVVARTPDALIPGRLVDMRIIPQKYFEQVGDSAFAQRPVGSGPYRITNFVANTSVTLEAWPESWRGPSKTKEWVWLLVPEPNTRLNALRTGQADIATGLSIDAAKALSASPDFKVAAIPAGAVVSVYLSPLLDSPFKDIRVRQAVRMAIDKKPIIDTLFSGFYRPISGQFVGEATFGHNPNARDPEYNPGRARQLLAEAGYPNGFKTTLEFNTGIPFVTDVGQYVADQLRQVGIEAQIDAMDINVWNTKFFASQLGPMQIIFSLVQPLLDADLTLQFWTSQGATRRMESPEFDRTLLAARAELDPAKRLALLQECIRIINDLHVIAPLYQPTQIWGYSSKINDFKKGVSFGFNVQGITKSL
ncbi:MAG: ABC transporter substrate-binding protein [Dehalococcoidia bacterium]|nr:MAG: ABC transporter substrate-binding protein [Dehalococcoidia bacterium]